MKTLEIGPKHTTNHYLTKYKNRRLSAKMVCHPFCKRLQNGRHTISPQLRALAVPIDMTCIIEIKKKLESYPEVEWELEGSTISVSPKGGFTVWLTESENDCRVGLNGWHEEFEDKKEALECFALGLSEKCRLKVFSRRKTEYKWVMEVFEDGDWVSYSTTCLIFIPFWKKKQSNYLQNNVLHS